MIAAKLTAALTALLVLGQADAQQLTGSQCGRDGFRWPERRAHVCEVRDLTVPAAAALSVSGKPNGSILVAGENRRDVQIHATVHAWARDEDEGRRILSEVTIRTDDGIRAEGPDRYGQVGWSVSYQLRTPRDIDLALETVNGRIEVADVRGRIEVEAVNGAITVDGVAGDVSARTTNGAVEAVLEGNTWDGRGLDARTTNGAIRLRIPDGYSAQLELGTVNGGFDLDIPLTLRGRIGREVSTTLGDGGPTIRAATTNGSVRVSRP